VTNGNTRGSNLNAQHSDCIAGFLAFKKELFEEAEQYFNATYGNYRKVRTYFSKYGISAAMSLPITDEVSAYVGPDVRGILLALVEIYHTQKKWEDALDCLNKLRRLEPDDVVVKLSLGQILMEARRMIQTYAGG